MTTWKLQKLVYYSQAWHLVWEDEPLFKDRIEAWANGPVVRTLYDLHAGRFEISRIPGSDSARLKKNERETIDVILDAFATKSAQWLSDLTLRERPWKEARRRAGLREGERGNAAITRAAMAEYYGGSYAEEETGKDQ